MTHDTLAFYREMESRTHPIEVRALKALVKMFEERSTRVEPCTDAKPHCEICGVRISGGRGKFPARRCMTHSNGHNRAKTFTGGNTYGT